MKKASKHILWLRSLSLLDMKREAKKYAKVVSLENWLENAYRAFEDQAIEHGATRIEGGLDLSTMRICDESDHARQAFLVIGQIGEFLKCGKYITACDVAAQAGEVLIDTKSRNLALRLLSHGPQPGFEMTPELIKQGLPAGRVTFKGRHLLTPLIESGLLQRKSRKDNKSIISNVRELYNQYRMKGLTQRQAVKRISQEIRPQLDRSTIAGYLDGCTGFTREAPRGRSRATAVG